jgi:hypothetical protein
MGIVIEADRGPGVPVLPRSLMLMVIEAGPK